jgi:hypothetical protein
MIITITKGKLMRWIITAVILFCGAVEADDAPKVIMSVMRHREFIADFQATRTTAYLTCMNGVPECLALSCFVRSGFMKRLSSIAGTARGR